MSPQRINVGQLQLLMTFLLENLFQCVCVGGGAASWLLCGWKLESSNKAADTEWHQLQQTLTSQFESPLTWEFLTKSVALQYKN